MLPSHADLTYFVEVARSLNVSRAAERLGIAQPSLSMSLKRLEAALGTQLLVRGKAGVQLTQAGKFLAHKGKELLSDWEAIRAGALRHETEIAGRFALGCHVSVAHYTLLAFLPRLMKENVGLEFRLEHDLSRKVTEQVISYQLDYGLVINPVSHPDLIIQELCTDRVTLWGRGGRMSETLIYDPGLLQVQDILQKLEARKVRFKRTVTSSSLEVVRELAASGLGVGILPGRVAQQAGKVLKPCGDHLPHFDDRLCLVYRVDVQKTAASRAIVAAIKKGLG